MQEGRLSEFGLTSLKQRRLTAILAADSYQKGEAMKYICFLKYVF